eukprot:sb/3474282/
MNGLFSHKTWWMNGKYHQDHPEVSKISNSVAFISYDVICSLFKLSKNCSTENSVRFGLKWMLASCSASKNSRGTKFCYAVICSLFQLSQNCFTEKSLRFGLKWMLASCSASKNSRGTKFWCLYLHPKHTNSLSLTFGRF